MATKLLQDFPSLSEYTESELKDLLTDEQFLNAFLYSLPQVQTVLEEQERLIQENEELAKRNLELQSTLAQLRTTTTSSYTTAQHLKDRWQEIESKQTALYQKQRPSFLHMRLRHSHQDQDALTESIAQAFIEGTTASSQVDSGMNQNGNVNGNGKSSIGSGSGTPTHSQTPEEFIRTFKTLRKTYHKRGIWCERWSAGQVAWRED